MRRGRRTLAKSKAQAVVMFGAGTPVWS